MRASDRTFHISFASSVRVHAYCPTCGNAMGPERRRRLLVTIFDSVCHRPICQACSLAYAPSLAALVMFEHGDRQVSAFGTPTRPTWSNEPQRWEVLSPIYEAEYVEEECVFEEVPGQIEEVGFEDEPAAPWTPSRAGPST